VYTPNSPQGRLRWVLRQYAELDPMAALCCVAIACELMDMERERALFFTLVHEFAQKLGPAAPETRRAVTIANLWVDGRYGDAEADRYTAEIGWADMRASPPPKHYEHDYIFPWIAREIHRALPLVLVGEIQDFDIPTFDAAHLGKIALSSRLWRKAHKIVRWAAATRADLNSLTATQAVEQLEAWIPYMPISPGEVVYRFADGWTIQRLTTVQQLDQEGDLVQNCLGDGRYDQDMLEGRIDILSLRNKRGRPRCSMEFSREYNSFVSIFGKQNQPPAEKYVERLKAFILDNYAPPVATVGLVLAGVTPAELNLVGAQFSGANLVSVSFVGADLRGARFSRCLIKRCLFEDCHLRHTETRSSIFARRHVLQLLVQRHAALKGAAWFPEAGRWSAKRRGVQPDEEAIA